MFIMTARLSSQADRVRAGRSGSDPRRRSDRLRRQGSAVHAARRRHKRGAPRLSGRARPGVSAAPTETQTVSIRRSTATTSWSAIMRCKKSGLRPDVLCRQGRPALCLRGAPTPPDAKGKVYATLLVYDCRIIGGDVTDAESDRLICGFDTGSCVPGSRPHRAVGERPRDGIPPHRPQSRARRPSRPRNPPQRINSSIAQRLKKEKALHIPRSRAILMLTEQGSSGQGCNSPTGGKVRERPRAQDPVQFRNRQ